MRSEKEIKKVNFFEVGLTCSPYSSDSREELSESKIKNWLLEGEPRYSVEELEKIMRFYDRNEVDDAPEEVWNINFIQFIKDQNKVKEILERD